MRPLALAGLRFGRLVALATAGSDRHGRVLWRCQCDCGGDTVVYATGLRRGLTRSCGCLSGASPLAVGSLDAARFWATVGERIPGRCWVWSGPVNRDGYGRVQVSGSTRLAHRVSWVLAHGDPGSLLKVCHHCDNPPCVNPEHLFLGTNAANQIDAVIKGRHRSPVHVGTRNPNARLTAEDATAILQRHGAGQGKLALAREYGVTKSTVRALVSGRTWASIAREGT